MIVVLPVLFVLELSKMFLVGSVGGISKPARLMTCCAMDFREDIPSGMDFGMRPLAVEETGEHEFKGMGDDWLLIDDGGDEDLGITFAISMSPMWFCSDWLCIICTDCSCD